MKIIYKLSFFSLLMFFGGGASAIDLCKEKDTPTFRQAMEQSPELMSEIAQYLGDEVVSQIKLESINLTKNIEAASRGISAVNAAKLRAIANGVAPATADALAKGRISASTTYIVDAQSKIGFRSSFLLKYGDKLKAVGGAAATWATFISAVDATCAFKALYFSENHDPAFQLQKAGEFVESALGGVVGIGAAAGAIPGPWSVILVETSITSKLINADLQVATDITEQESANYQSLADRYLMLLNIPKILAGKGAQFPIDEKSKLVKAAQEIRNDIDRNRIQLKGLWARIAIRSAPRNSILSGYDTLSGLLEPVRFSSLLDNAFLNARKEVEQRRSRMLPTTLTLPSSLKYPIGLAARVALQTPLNAVWDGKMANIVNITSSDDIKSLKLNAVSLNNQVLATAEVQQSRKVIPGVTNWSTDFARAPGWVNLGNGNYRVQAVAVDHSNKIGVFYLGQFQVQKKRQEDVRFMYLPNPVQASRPIVIPEYAVKQLSGTFARPDQDLISTKNITVAALNKFIKIRSALPFALIADDVYNNSSQLPSSAVEVVDTINSNTNLAPYARAVGFYAAVYRIKATDTYVFAFRGTGPDRLNKNVFSKNYDYIVDLIQDAALTVGVGTPQHVLALLYSDASMRKFSGKPVVFVGHSLGGGLAQYVAWTYGAQAKVFNPAAVPLTTTVGVKGNGTNIERFVVDSEKVAEGSDSVPGLSQHFGTEIRMYNAGTQYRAIDDLIKSEKDTPWYVTAGAATADIITGFSSKHGNDGVLSNISSYGTVLQYIEKVASLQSSPLAGTVNGSKNIFSPSGIAIKLSGTVTGGAGNTTFAIKFTKPDGTPAGEIYPTSIVQNNTWSAPYIFKEAGIYNYKVFVSDFTKSVLEIGSGQINVSSVNQAPLIQRYQPKSIPQVNQQLSIMFFGQDLYDQVRINIPGCGQETYKLQDTQSLLFTCVPTVAGQHSISWKDNSLDKVWRNLDVPLTVGPVLLDAKVSAVQPASVLMVDVPAVFKVMGVNLSVGVPLTFGGCVEPQQIFINSQNMELRCTPKLSGYQYFGWKPNASVTEPTKEPTKAGSFNVLTRIIDLPLPSDGMTHVNDSPVDDSLLDGAASIEKTWVLRNSGTKPWTNGFCLSPVSGNALGGGQVCVPGNVQPGQTHIFTTRMTMPVSGATQVQVKQNWRLTNAANVQVGPVVWARFQVKGRVTPLKVVEPFAMPTAVRVTTERWVGDLVVNAVSDQVQMVLTDSQGRISNLAWSKVTPTRWGLQHSFPTAGVYRWNLTVTGLSGVDTRNGTVNVLGNTGDGGIGRDAMSFVSQTVPDNEVVGAAKVFSKAWTLKNSGTTTWNSTYCLKPVSGDSLGTGQVCVQGTVAPNANYVFNVPMTAPTAKPTKSTYKQIWALSNAAGQVGPAVWAQIKISAGAPVLQFPTAMASALPVSVAANQPMTFNATLSSNQGVTKVELVFPGTNGLPEAMTQTGPTVWMRSNRVMQSVSQNRPFAIKVTLSDGRSQEVANGTYSVSVAAGVADANPKAAALGKPVRITVTGSQLAPTIKLSLTGEQCSSSLSGNTESRVFECSVNNAASPKTMSVTALNGQTLWQGVFTVITGTGGTVGSGNTGKIDLPPPPPLNPLVQAPGSIDLAKPWTVRMSAAAYAEEASLVFTNGRRLALQPAGANTWTGQDQFGTADTYDYKVEMRRTRGGAAETYAGGQVTVIQNVPVVQLRSTSTGSAELGKPYTLSATTDRAVQSVQVKWADTATWQGLANSANQWNITRIFNSQGEVGYNLRALIPGSDQPVATTSGKLKVVPPNASGSVNWGKAMFDMGDRPRVAITVSPGISKATLTVEGQAAIEKVNSNPQSQQSLYVDVPLVTPGKKRWTLTATNTAGQSTPTLAQGEITVNQLNVSFALESWPAEVTQGQTIVAKVRPSRNLISLTLQGIPQWGNLVLPGSSNNWQFSRLVDLPPNTYPWRLLGVDSMGNTFQQAGQLVVKPGNVQTTLRIDAPREAKVGTPITFKIISNQPVGFVRFTLGKWGVIGDISSSDKVNWTVTKAIPEPVTPLVVTAQAVRSSSDLTPIGSAVQFQINVSK